VSNRAKASAAQRAEVLRLAEGVSVRAVAARVFGDARYRGRVERIVRGARGQLPCQKPGIVWPQRPDLTGLAPVEALRALFEWRLAVWAVSEEPPSMTQLAAMVRVQVALEGMERVERLRPRRKGEE